MFTERDVLSALRSVIDPDLGKDIVSLGMVRDISIEGSKVGFRFVLTTPACPLKDKMEREAREALLTIKGVEDVEIKMDAKVTSRALTERRTIPGVKNVIAVTSGKGGVGKTTVSVNIAVALAQSGASVGLLDADIYGPNIPIMMGIKGRPQTEGQRAKPLEAYGVKVMSMGFFLPSDDAPVIWRGPMLNSMLRQFLFDVDWGELDYLVVDMPPGTGDVQLTLAQSVPITGGIIVTTPQDVASIDAKKALVMLRKVGVPLLGIVENMSYFICPHCGGRSEIFGKGGGERIGRELGVPFLGGIPLDPSIRAGGDSGKPASAEDPESPRAKAFREIAGALARRVSVVDFEMNREEVNV
ncbi:MAG: Mrp/NBP35 family ATP-binding protein [bacterium]